jgi:O-antigen/teichoic acid export membrane protein
LIKRTLRSWGQDRLLWGIIKNSGYLFSSNSAAVVLTALQGILAARLLGIEGYGVLAATIIPFVSNINRLLSFRMSELVVKYVGQYLVEGRRDRAAAVVKGAAMVEAATAVLAFAVLLAAAPLAANLIAKDPSAAPFFMLYGIIIITNAFYETSLGVLQVSRLFKRIALVNFIQSVLTASIILWAYLSQGGILEVLLAYLVGKTFAGGTVVFLAYRQLTFTVGRAWLRAPLSLLPERRELFRFAVSTNLNGTVNLIARDSETLLIAFLRSPIEAGYYRIALTLINLVMLPIEPLISTTYAEIARTVSRRDWGLTRRLLKRVSALSAVWTLGAGGVIAALGWLIIPILYSPEYSPAYPALLILIVGYGFANIFNWSRTLMLALGMPAYPVKVSAAAAAVKTAGTFAFVGAYGYLLQAVLLSGYFLAANGLVLWRGLSEIQARAATGAPRAEPESPRAQ